MFKIFFDVPFLNFSSKIVELEEELRVVGNNLKSLEVSEEKVCLNTYSYNIRRQSYIFIVNSS